MKQGLHSLSAAKALSWLAELLLNFTADYSSAWVLRF